MQTLIIYGVPGYVDQGKLEGLILQLQMSTSAVLSIPSSEVSVFFPTDRVEKGLGEELVCVVIGGLFDEPERTTKTRQHLAECILELLKAFSALELQECGKIKVIVNRFDQDTDGFAVWGRWKD